MNYKEEVEKIMQESQEEIRQSVKEKIKEKIVDNLSWDLDDEIKSQIKDVVETELSEEVRKIVIESKQEILNGLKPAFANIGAIIAKEFEKKATENLQKSWKTDAIFKGLFD